MKVSFLASGWKTAKLQKEKKKTRESGVFWFPTSRKLSFDEERGGGGSRSFSGKIYMIGYLFIVTERIQEATPPTM